MSILTLKFSTWLIRSGYPTETKLRRWPPSRLKMLLLWLHPQTLKTPQSLQFVVAGREVNAVKEPEQVQVVVPVAPEEAVEDAEGNQPPNTPKLWKVRVMSIYSTVRKPGHALTDTAAL